MFSMGANAEKLGELTSAADRLFQLQPDKAAIIVLLNGGGPGFRKQIEEQIIPYVCLLYTSPSPRDLSTSRMPSSA